MEEPKLIDAGKIVDDAIDVANIVMDSSASWPRSKLLKRLTMLMASWSGARPMPCMRLFSVRETCPYVIDLKPRLGNKSWAG